MNSTSTPAVAVRGVTKRYGAVAALTGIDLDIKQGEIVCLLGPNGSGKTTLIRLLTGFLNPDDGVLQVAGFDVQQQPMQARQCIGYAPESAPMYRHMRVGEFLAFMARLRQVPAHKVHQAVDRVAEQLELTDKLQAPVPTLSRGYRQRVCIAQALLHEPQLLILDEPSNGLDPRQIIEMRHLIRSLAKKHTVLMSSHILSEVAKTADRVVVLMAGKLKGERPVSPEDTDLEDWFLSLA
ncbi:ABC transporter ATP-binding protein [Rhodoferax sp.]|uniref:ABC transporter ATP-binding protein n=1 Tax=Rhodoferax sp. TaxID=50421 RepID=UPI001EC30A58|nr:ABC transporter ATP-binding protein [Rhodoferax sp.]MBT9508186.1 ABC transporter ATP-binding protein [Rhodoferax sp.]